MKKWIRSKMSPTPPPYNPYEWRKLPLKDRAKLACQAWAMQGFGAPLSVYLFYLFKTLFYVYMWIWFCSFSPTLGDFSSIDQWYLKPIALQKAILWSMLFEVLGLGCGSGPLTARYIPPFGGASYFLRRGTIKRALWPQVPIIGGQTRGVIDVSLYLGLIGSLCWLLMSPSPTDTQLLLITVLLPLLGVLDQTIFLIARAEHYWMMTFCFYWAGERVDLWLSGLMVIQLALWFWAGISKLNPHFPSVITVMLSNHPFNRSKSFRKQLYRDYPHDLQPSTLARTFAHLGAGLELITPILFFLACTNFMPIEIQGYCLIAGVICALNLHFFITSNVPMGVPIEWNVVIIYSVFAIFWAHPELNPFTTIYQWSSSSTIFDQVLFILILIMGTVFIPLVGNLHPKKVSFLLSMRYYAGNWPYSVWLFKGGSEEKLKQLKMTAPWITDQLGILYDEETVEGVIGRVMGFRLMHLQGRALNALIPLAIDAPLSEYRYVEGEVFSGLVIGWNFGDGHLHQEGLLSLVQAQCGFEEGDLRCIFVESQPLGADQMSYEVHDARLGLLQSGEVKVSALLKVQPWEAPTLDNIG